MNTFELHRNIIHDYQSYIHSFININDVRIKDQVKKKIESGFLLPDPIIQFNPSFQKGAALKDLISEGLHPEMDKIFANYQLYKHQELAIKLGVKKKGFIVTSGTGSGKSLTYLATIFNSILHQPKDTKGIQAIIVYPMNALINSQLDAINEFKANYEKTGSLFPITYAKYTGQESQKEKDEIIRNPPHVLLTNYMMLELMLTRTNESILREHIFNNLNFLAFDELHTYRGRQGSDVAMLVRRLKAKCTNKEIICMGTSATMLSTGSYTDKKNVVANVASKFFAVTFGIDQVVNEYLEKVTIKEYSNSELTSFLNGKMPSDFSEEELLSNPLAIWLENNNIINWNEEGQFFERQKPSTIKEIAKKLEDETGIQASNCQPQLEAFLLKCAKLNTELRNNGSRKSYFAYKLHQFINQTGSVFVTMQGPNERLIELEGKRSTVPSEGSLEFYQVVFSRVSGQEFLCVAQDLTQNRLKPRLFRSSSEDEEQSNDGYFLPQPNGADDIWDLDRDIESLPENWLNTDRNGNLIVKKDQRYKLPQLIYVDNRGNISTIERSGYIKGWFISVDAAFDVSSGTIYDTRTSQYTIYSSLGVEGRSTSTDVIAFSIIKQFKESGLSNTEQKLMSFTDNRQDTALQSGHFNDFIKSGLLRSSIYHALNRLKTLDYLSITEEVFKSLRLNNIERLNDLVQKPVEEGSFQYRTNIEAVKEALFYKILTDLKRGWRVIMPNLEQCALLRVDYKELEAEAKKDKWKSDRLLHLMSEVERVEFFYQILDYFRKSNAIRLDVLSKQSIDKNRKLFNETLKESWLYSKNEDLSKPRYINLERPANPRNVSLVSIGMLSAPGRFIKNLLYQKTNTRFAGKQDYEAYVAELINNLVSSGYLVRETNILNDVSLYQLNGQYILWNLGDENDLVQDKIKNPSYMSITPEVNYYFQDFYKTNFGEYKNLLAHEHSGQLKNQMRVDAENRFKTGDISLLCCSPTMELGIDIASLNAVHMRNVPPDPSNYAQRSGRAGRSGQGGLIFTFCASMSAHDQHYFHNRIDMVSGVVQAPRFDFSNEELIKTHLYANWLAETSLSEMNNSIAKLVDESTTSKEFLELLSDVKLKINLDIDTIKKLIDEFKEVVSDEHIKQLSSDWLVHNWIYKHFKEASIVFESKLNRWRNLYRLALEQQRAATAIINDPTIPAKDEQRRQANRNQNNALKQIYLLRNDSSGNSSYTEQSEFYPFRYFAAEGFLPGYNFTRLPIRLFIPHEEGQFISRPRFLALREFGPRNNVYYMGNKFRNDKMPVNEMEKQFKKAKICLEDSYIIIDSEEYQRNTHPISNIELNSSNTNIVSHLLELSESRAEEQGRITCEEEERINQGYEIKTYFNLQGNIQRVKRALATIDDQQLLEITFLPAARLYKINHKWRSRDFDGFRIGENSGQWKKQSETITTPVSAEPTFDVRIFTQDTADAIYIKPLRNLNLNNPRAGSITLLYAIKRAIETYFQIESREIGAEVVGKEEEPNILIYEAAEGSLGILRKLVEDNLFPQIAKLAYELCHFNKTEEEQSHFGTASYFDLLSYYNQFYHELVNRYEIKDALLNLMQARYAVILNASFESYEAQYEWLLDRFDPKSSTELTFLKFLNKNGLRLPDEAQVEIKDCRTVPDFVYKNEVQVCVFIDGSPHDDPDTQKNDAIKRKCLENAGYEVLVWHYLTPLEEWVKGFPHIFKKVKI